MRRDICHIPIEGGGRKRTSQTSLVKYVLLDFATLHKSPSSLQVLVPVGIAVSAAKTLSRLSDLLFGQFVTLPRH
jgi:hypothetical protein